MDVCTALQLQVPMSSARIEDATEVRGSGRDPLAAKPSFQTQLQSMQPSALEAEHSVMSTAGPAPIEKQAGSAPLQAGNDRGTVRRSLTIEISGSLTKLAADGVQATWSVANNASAVFQPERSDKGYSDVAGQCDITNTVMHSVTVTDVRSSFPCSVGVDISGITGTHATREGKKYALVVQGDTKWQGSKKLLEPDEMTNSDYLKKYPGMTPEKIAKEGIVPVPGESYVFVDSNHPVVEMLTVNQDLLQVNMADAELIDGRWYKVAGEVVSDCTKLLDQQLLQHLPLVNLSTFNVSAERLGGMAWDRMDSISDDLMGKNMDPMIERIMTKTNSLSLQLELEYTFM